MAGSTAGDYLAELHALAPEAALIVDKMPGNARYLGWAIDRWQRYEAELVPLIEGLEKWCAKKGIRRVAELTGAGNLGFRES